MTKTINIIGAGPGGLTAGMILSSKGYIVNIYEKSSKVGGRNGLIELGDYKFDTGPTFLMLTEILENVFNLAGESINDYLELMELKTLYNIRYSNQKDFTHYKDKDLMIQSIKNIFPGEEEGFEKFIESEKDKFNAFIPALKQDYNNIFSLFSKNLLKSLIYFNPFNSLFDTIGKYFKIDEMKVSMTFQSKYLGMSPWKCPDVFTIIPYIEHQLGLFHVKGGLNQISNQMAKIIIKNGGKIHLNTNITQILTENKKIIGIKDNSGTIHKSDITIMNADFAYGMSTLIDEKSRKKYTNKKLESMEYSCSAYMIYLGLDKIYDLKHHNIVLCKDYRKNIDDIIIHKKLSKDFSMYIQNASINDDTLAPKGHSCLYILVPVPNNESKINWQNIKNDFFDKTLELIENNLGIKDIKNHIKKQLIITPYEWEKEYNVYKGAIFNLSHKVSQMIYRRPHNKSEEFDNLFIVGGGTNPGSGLPTIYQSGIIASNLIEKE